MRPPEAVPLLVGIGATAESCEALLAFFGAIPEKCGMSFVIVQHPEPAADSRITKALAGCAALPVSEIVDETTVETNHVYVIGSNLQIAIEKGVLRPGKWKRTRGRRSAIDRFFTSLAVDAGERAVGIVLSGGSADGTAGLKDIKERGGLTLVEEPREAEQDGLLTCPFASSHVDMILPAARMPEKLVSYARHSYLRGPLFADPAADDDEAGQRAGQAGSGQLPQRSATHDGTPAVRHAGDAAGAGRISGLSYATADQELLPITELLRLETTHDFRRYRKNTLWRRVQRRMGLNQVDGIPEYLQLLRENRLEVQALRRDLLICVTRFFRDAEAWDVLENKVLRDLVAGSKGIDEPIRVWIPGCATGEEPYTLAMLLHEELAASGVERRLQVFATDIADDALDVARSGVYPESIEADVSRDRLRRFFTHDGGRYRVNKKLRDSVVFAEQNVLAQPPFSRLDLICCRNLLIYLEPDAQQRVLVVFQYALKEGGHLFLGNSETVGAAKPLFTSVSKKWRIFRRTSLTSSLPIEQFDDTAARLTMMRKPQMTAHVRAAERTRGIAARVQGQLLKEYERGIAVVDGHNRLMYLHGSADLYLQLSVGEVSADYPDVLTLAREGLRSKLRVALQQVRQSQKSVTVECRVLRDARYHKCAATVRPLAGGVEGEGTLFLSFEPIRPEEPRPGGDSAELDRPEPGSSMLRELQHELATTREQLNGTIEDLARANDALKATNEEAISMNEELQSGNEELETSKEELQSLNEELTTLNYQLESKVAELQTTTNDLDNLLTSSHVPTIFLDTEWRIRRFTPSCKELFNLIASDIGRPLTDIVADVADPKLLVDARTVLDDLQPRERQVRSTDGTHYFQRRVLPYRTGDDRIQGVVITYSDVTYLQRISLSLQRRERQQKALASLGQRALSETDLQALVAFAMETVKRTFDADCVKFLELLPDGNAMLLRAGIGWRDGVVGQLVIDKDSDSQAAYTLLSNEPVVVSNLHNDRRFAAPALLLEHGIVSGISTIVRGRSKPIGVLGIYTRHEARFKEDDIDFVEAVAHILSEAIQRRGSEQAMRAAEERLRLATAATDLGTWDYNPQTDVIIGSARSKELIGLPRDAVVRYDTYLEKVHPRDRRRVDVAIRRSLDPKGAGHCDLEYRIGAAEGEVLRWVRDTRQTFFADDRAVRMIGTLEDITTRKEAEQADIERLHLADRLQMIAEATPGTIFTFRVGAEGGPPSFPYVAPHVRDTWGLAPEEIAHNAMPLFARIPPEDNKLLEQTTIESARTMSMWHAQFRYNHPQKGEVWIESYASPVAEDGGAILWHGIAHDITEIKQTELELLEARRVAEAADRAKGEFLANMSHEIRTPMSAILGYTEILSGQLKNPDNLQSLDTIRSNGLHLLEIIDDILDLSRIEAGKLEMDRQKVRPDSLVWDVHSLLKLHAAEKGLDLVAEFDGQLPETIETDPTRLRQILINLIENAIKFTDAGEVRIVVRLLADESRLRFDVVDSGIGIPDETLSKLFRPFTQADSSVTRRFGGSGLGLSICRALGKMLGGDVSVATRVGHGSTFTLTIGTGDLTNVPLVEPRQSRRTPTVWRDEIRTLSSKVLVVDDRRDMRYLAQHMLEEAGAEVALAVDGRDALARVAEGDEQNRPFDAILLDMQMPELDGYAAAAELRKLGFDQPIIALTANAMKQDEKKCLECGCDDYLSKPLARSTLINTLAYYTQEVSTAELKSRREAYSLRSAGAQDEAPASREEAGANEETSDGGLVKVLIVDDNQDSCTLLKMLLESDGCEVTLAADGEAALALSEDAVPDVAIIDLGLPGMSGGDLVGQMRSRPQLAQCRYICLSGRHLSEVDWKGFGFQHFLQKPAKLDQLKKLINGN